MNLSVTGMSADGHALISCGHTAVDFRSALRNEASGTEPALQAAVHPSG